MFLFLMILINAVGIIKTCELPEHLQMKELISIRTADGIIDHLPIAWIKNSTFLCNLATSKQVNSDVDIDLISYKDTDLKNILTGKNIRLLLEEVETSKSTQKWPNILSELIQLKKAYDHLNIIEKKQETFKRFSTCHCHPGDKEYLWGGHISRGNTHNAFYSPIFHLLSSWKYEDIIHTHNIIQTEITVSSKENLDFEDLACTDALKLCNVVQVTCNENEQNVIAFDFKKVSTLQGISIVSSSSIPSLELKNLSGNEDFCVNIEGNISPAQHQKLSRMLWPHLYSWYKPSTVLTIAKHRTAQIISISTSVASGALMASLCPYFYLMNEGKSQKYDFLYFLAAIPCYIVGLVPGGIGCILLQPAINSFREKHIYNNYSAQNKLIINGTLETPFTNGPLHIVENKLAHMTNGLFNWLGEMAKKIN